MLLRSKDTRYFLRLDLVPLAVSRHQGWHSYRISMGLSDGTTEDLGPRPGAPLFLDAARDPEIPSLCSGMRGVLRAGGTYRFSPCDDRDFVLELSVVDGELTLRLDAEDRPFSRALGWPDGLVVAAESVARFTDGLLLEFDEVCGVSVSATLS